MEQARHVQLRMGGKETLLRLFCNIPPCQHPCARCLCSVIHLGDVAPGPFLVEELLAGKEPVHQEVQALVEPVQEINVTLAVVPVISHELADDRVVLFFHMGVVVLVIGTGTGEGNILSMTEAREMSVHELTPVIGMQGEDAPRVPVETRLQGSDHNHFCFRAGRPCFGPSGAPVGDSKCPAEVPRHLSSVMAH